MNRAIDANYVDKEEDRPRLGKQQHHRRKKNATTKTTQPTTKEQVLFCKTMQLLSNSR
jgi:hypothetical protein